MIICSCKGVTDTEIREAILDGATTPAAIGARLGAGTDCGSCRNLLALLVKQAQSVPAPAGASAEAEPEPLPWRNLRDALAGV